MSPQDGSSFVAFNEDEIRAQGLAGSGTGRAPIRSIMPEQHRDFFALLPYLFTATLDVRGWPMASVLTGDAGFVQSPDPSTLDIAALPAAGDPAVPGFIAGAEIGLLGLDFTTRRRNRANGRLLSVDRGLRVRIAQSFGNCPQYIQTRRPAPRPVAAAAAVESLPGLDADARASIVAADTLFVASRARADAQGPGGLDISHRGGRPGFVAVQGDTLAIPDFRGNRFYNTLGNLLGDPRAGLLFIDFATGDILQVQGRVTIDWHPAGGPKGNERLWQLKVEWARRRRGAFPFAWAFDAYAPSTLATGIW